jgi:hypothetical protein
VTALLVLYASTLFVGASLLFVVQPMMGKMILPLLGGSPAVWSTCMVFFQAMLLAGYAYAHVSAGWLAVPRQALVHLGLLALALAFLPFGVNADRFSGVQRPALEVLLLLSASVGLPFFVVSATAPLLQRWFTYTGTRASRDPYFLYAASNLGSVLALLSYPTFIERRLPLRGPGWLSQTHLWTLAYLLLIALTALCALPRWRRAPPAGHAPGEQGEDWAPEGVTEKARVSPGQRVWWVALSFAPSSLLLGVTTYITTDIAAVPFLWVLPLTIYLLTFILAFGRWPAPLQRWVVAISLPAVLVVMYFMVSSTTRTVGLMIAHLGLLFVLALACHGALALGRPSPRHLTEFYLLISVGGVLGGLFNALVAPAVFRSLIEYPLAIVLACALVRGGRDVSRVSALAALLDITLAIAVGVLAVLLYSKTVSLGGLVKVLVRVSATWADWFERNLLGILTHGLPLIVSFFLRRRSLALALCLLAVLLVGQSIEARDHHYIREIRNFFGVLRVARTDGTEGETSLYHGSTLHGRQKVDPARRQEPLSYYHREGPLGQVFDELDERAGPREVAVIGLGTGTLAAYARRGDTMTFYEIDRDIRNLALDPVYFTYVTDARARGATVRLEMGDARLRLEAVKRERASERYDLIVIDAFSSDAIPVHLLTREVVGLYLAMLKPDGLVAIHISNRHLALEPVVANLAEDAGLGGGLVQDDDAPEASDADRSHWALLARTSGAFGRLGAQERWRTLRLETDRRVGVWTDDFHNLFSVLRWRR